MVQDFRAAYPAEVAPQYYPSPVQRASLAVGVPRSYGMAHTSPQRLSFSYPVSESATSVPAYGASNRSISSTNSVDHYTHATAPRYSYTPATADPYAAVSAQTASNPFIAQHHRDLFAQFLHFQESLQPPKSAAAIAQKSRTEKQEVQDEDVPMRETVPATVAVPVPVPAHVPVPVPAAVQMSVAVSEVTKEDNFGVFSSYVLFCIV